MTHIIGSNKGTGKPGDIIKRGLRNTESPDIYKQEIECRIIRIATLKEFADAYEKEHGRIMIIRPFMRNATFYEVEDI